MSVPLRVSAVILFIFTLFAPGTSWARSAGIASSTFLTGSPPNCQDCHSGGTAPVVTLNADDLTLDAEQQILLTVTVTTVNGNPGAAGFNLRASQQGTFSVGGPDSANTRTITGTNNWLEATHSSPKQGEPATFTVFWTPGPLVTGTVTFTAWGNAVNGNGSPSGDQAASATLDVTTCATPWYPDADKDGYGSATGAVGACSQPTGYVANNTDCNDTNAAVHPGATEVCNGIDDNCVGGIDNGLPTTTYYRDKDGDGFGAASSGTKQACSAAQAGAGWVTTDGDCDDNTSDISPNAPEICDNHKDDDCDGVIDTDATGTATFYRDLDGDGFGSAASGTIMACAPPRGYVSTQTDCDDQSASVYPSAPELCNGIDDDCDGNIEGDDVCPVDPGGDGGTGGTGSSGTGGANGGVGAQPGAGTGGISGATSMGGSAGDADAGAPSAGAEGLPEAGSAGAGGDGSVPSTPGAGGEGGTSGGAAGSGGAGLDAGAGGSSDAPTNGDDGCGCRAPGRDTSPHSLGVLAFVGFCLARRLRRRAR